MISSAAIGSLIPALPPPAAVPAKLAQQNDTALEMLQQAAAQQRGSFSPSELGEILTALAPVANAIPAGETGNGFGQVLSELATKRAAGPVIMVVVQPAEGGSMIAALTPEELAAALASDDPGVLGSITTNGKTTYFRDALLESLTAKTDETAATIPPSATTKTTLPPKEQLAQAISEMLRKASSDPDPLDAASTAGKATQVADAVGKDGARATILAFPARVTNATPGEPGMLLDVEA